MGHMRALLLCRVKCSQGRPVSQAGPDLTQVVPGSLWLRWGAGRPGKKLPGWRGWGKDGGWTKVREVFVDGADRI